MKYGEDHCAADSSLSCPTKVFLQCGVRIPRTGEPIPSSRVAMAVDDHGAPRISAALPGRAEQRGARRGMADYAARLSAAVGLQWQLFIPIKDLWSSALKSPIYLPCTCFFRQPGNLIVFCESMPKLCEQYSVANAQPAFEQRKHFLSG